MDSDDNLSTAIGQLIVGAFFFGMRSYKYSTTTKGENKRARILRKGGSYSTGNGASYCTSATVYTWKIKCPIHSGHQIIGSGTRQWPSGRQENASTQIYHHKTEILPRNIRRHPSEHSVGREPQNSYNISNENQINKFRHTLLQIGTSPILTQWRDHPFTLVGIYIERFLARVNPETIIIIGLWSINSFLWYIRIQVNDISKGIIDLMVSTQDFYIIPEAEVIWYTCDQPGV